MIDIPRLSPNRKLKKKEYETIASPRNSIKKEKIDNKNTINLFVPYLNFKLKNKSNLR